MIDEQPNLNTGTPWSETDLRNIEWSLKKESIRGAAWTLSW